jgi:hypothetical protein
MKPAERLEGQKCLVRHKIQEIVLDKEENTLRADLVVRDPKGIHRGEIPLQFNFE